MERFAHYEENLNNEKNIRSKILGGGCEVSSPLLLVSELFHLILALQTLLRDSSQQNFISYRLNHQLCGVDLLGAQDNTGLDQT